MKDNQKIYKATTMNTGDPLILYLKPKKPYPVRIIRKEWDNEQNTFVYTVSLDGLNLELTEQEVQSLLPKI